MNQLGAFRDTVTLARERGLPPLPESSIGLEHLEYMLQIVELVDFSESKLGRWLGWAQCALVSQGLATLEDMKTINKGYADD